MAILKRDTERRLKWRPTPDKYSEMIYDEEYKRTYTIFGIFKVIQSFILKNDISEIEDKSNSTIGFKKK